MFFAPLFASRRARLAAAAAGPLVTQSVITAVTLPAAPAPPGC